MTDNQDFAQLTDSFRPVVHLMMLVWKHSKHYNTPARLVVLMREICNELIRQARAAPPTAHGPRPRPQPAAQRSPSSPSSPPPLHAMAPSPHTPALPASVSATSARRARRRSPQPTAHSI